MIITNHYALSIKPVN